MVPRTHGTFQMP